MPLLLDSFDDDLVYAVTVFTVFFCLMFFVFWRFRKAKQAVIREWDSWAARNPEETNTSLGGGRRFFQYLQQERPELLDFPVYFASLCRRAPGWARPPDYLSSDLRFLTSGYRFAFTSRS